jgi:hypothetical protein
VEPVIARVTSGWCIELRWAAATRSPPFGLVELFSPVEFLPRVRGFLYLALTFCLVSPSDAFSSYFVHRLLSITFPLEEVIPIDRERRCHQPFIQVSFGVCIQVNRIFCQIRSSCQTTLVKVSSKTLNSIVSFKMSFVVVNNKHSNPVDRAGIIPL